MESSFLYYSLGVRGVKCTGTQYKGNKIIFNAEFKHIKKRCPCCGKEMLVRNGYRIRDLHCVPSGDRAVILRIKVRRYKCTTPGCSYDGYEQLPFCIGSCSYTRRFAKYVCKMLRSMTIKAVSSLLGISWDMVKEIHSRYLKRHYSPPEIKGVSNIGIDEFAVRRGHVYKTIVVDLDSGRILHVGRGNGADALRVFWNRVRRHGVSIKNVATDMSVAFISSVMRNAPDAVHVFDRFHVMKLMNDALDSVRRTLFRTERNVNRRKVLMGTRFLLLRNGRDIMDERYRNRLENVLAMNEPLSKAYYLKESMAGIWQQTDKAAASEYLDEWVRQARDCRHVTLTRVANSIAGFKSGILAWYDCRFSNAKVEGINNKIKVLKRQAFGFRDDK